jgi:hypothetical protein
MPKKEIDYSNTIIYKIGCKNAAVMDIYVGHTTNFVQRKYAHKQNCNNIESPNHMCKLYKIIRENGGWNNWKMEAIAVHNCCDHYEAMKKENEYFYSLGATLNNNDQLPRQKPKTGAEFPNALSCENQTKTICDHENKFICEPCDYKCSLKQHMSQHLLSKRHKNNLINAVENSVNAVENSVNDTENKIFECECGVSYRDRSGLWRHRKTCKQVHNETKNRNSIIHKFSENDTEKEKYNDSDKKSPELMTLITELVKSHHELQDSFLELCKNGTHNTINTTNMMNSNNKTFNLNMFLNETCKDAMNITEFVDSIKLQLSDLENVGELGYVKGISNIIVKNLNALDITRRPVHCADRKREVLYVKDDNKWEKESDENQKLRKMIKRVAFKNYKQISQFKAKHPDCNKSVSKYSDQYNKIIIESMGGEGDNEKENEDKIIRNISKEVVIDKTLL